MGDRTGYGIGMLVEQALVLAELGLRHEDLVTELTLVNDDPKAFAAARQALHARLSTTEAGVRSVAAARALAAAGSQLHHEVAAAA